MMNPNISIADLNATNKDTLMESLGIEYTEVGTDYLCAKMPVDTRTFQPMGLLHGGANVALAETIGSIGSHITINDTTHYVVCSNINANHIRSATKGYVYGKGTVVHQGRSTHVWSVEIKDDAGKLLSVARLTMMIIAKK